MGGVTTGAEGCAFLGVCRDEEGEVGVRIEVLSTPSEFMSTPSLSMTVPSARSACSKSRSVRDTRRFKGLVPVGSSEVPGCKPMGNAVGGTTERVCVTFGRNIEARVGSRQSEKVMKASCANKLVVIQSPRNSYSRRAPPHSATIITTH